MDFQQLKAARDQQTELEREVLQDIEAKAQLLGYQLVLSHEREISQPKQKRKRRTKAEIEAAAQAPAQ